MAAAVPEYHNPVAPEFPILAWYSILPDSAQTPGRYAELREAGFNISFSHFYHDEQLDAALEAAKGSGVKIMGTSTGVYNNTRETINKYKDNPGIAGWFMRDEPVAAGFAGLSVLRDSIFAADQNKHLMYLNLLPIFVEPKDLGTRDYEEYVQRFVDEVRLPLISYDLYPIVRDDSTGTVYWRERHFDNLEVVSRVARRNNMPFWAFCLATAHHPYPVPEEAHLRFEAFTALAYGAQGIEYFTYWQPPTGTWDFHNAPIDETGKRTDVYYKIKNLNKEIQALAPVFLGAEVDNVSFVGTHIPVGTKAMTTLPEGFESITTDGPTLLVSQFHNGKNRYIMLVNADIDHAQTVKAPRRKGLKRYNPDGTTTADDPTQPIILAPGSYYLARY